MFKSGGTAQFDKLLEKATSNLLLEPDWGSIMMICDLIRQKDCPPKHAVAAIKKKLHHQNPHVAMFGLQVLESIVKNCGSPVHDEVATKQFMEELRDITKTSHHENVKDKILELILTWANAFRTITSYRAVQDVCNIMKAEGAAFKPLQESDAMFVADTAPDWADGECCHRCRTEFGIVVRKHHCRACGQIFCNKCSSKICTLPKFGIEKEVRVCDSCFEKYGKDGSSTSDPDDLIMRAAQPQPRLVTQAPAQPGSTGPRAKTEEELAEEEQLQLALAISQSEAEAKEIESKKRGSSAYYTPSAAVEVTSPTNNEKNNEKSSPQKTVTDSEDPELARYLNRNYWETRSKDENSKEETGTMTGKGTSTTEKTKPWNSLGYSFVPSAPIKENKDKAEPVEEIGTFVENLRSQIEIFVNRMKSNSTRGRPIAYDTSVQGPFMNITSLHSQLLNFIQLQDNARGYYEGLQDKLGQIRDARAALDDLRFEHTEKLRRQAEEQARIKQLQMEERLDVMRQKKQAMLQYQRQAAMQRMQDQEREMQMRIEQQSRAMGQNPYGGYPQNPAGMQGGYMPSHPDMAYNMPQQQQGAYMIPPNVSIGHQGQIPMSQGQAGGQYMPQQQQGGQYIPPQQMQQQQQQQQQQPGQMQMQIPQSGGVPSQHNMMSPQGQPPNIPQQQQQQPNFHQVPGNDPNASFQQQQGQPPLPQGECSTAELISFD